MTKAPERIYLQAGMDYTDAIVNGEVTWCADRQEDDDTEYLRAAPSPEAFQQMREALEEMLSAYCGDNGFAACVRSDTGLAYPWEAGDVAEELARAALKAAEGE